MEEKKFNGLQKLYGGKEKAIKENTMIDIDKIIRLRNLILTAIQIEKEDKSKFSERTQAYSYRLGKLHCLEDFKEKLNSLIIQG